jgi:hypothetical protein
MNPHLAHCVFSQQTSASVAFGGKRTLGGRRGRLAKSRMTPNGHPDQSGRVSRKCSLSGSVPSFVRMVSAVTPRFQEMNDWLARHITLLGVPFQNWMVVTLMLILIASLINLGKKG